MGARFRYTVDHIAFLEAGYPLMRGAELTAKFNTHFGLNKSEKAIRTVLKNRNIKCGRKPGFRKGENIRLFTGEQLAFIKREYRTYSVKSLTKILNKKFGLSITPEQLKTFISNHGILSGRNGRFGKGSQPWNTGTKGVCKPNDGSFRKGSIPPNLKPLGHERVCSKDGYILVKIQEENPYTGEKTRYKAKHIVVWEKHNGPVPKGFNVRFIDGDKTNCDIENLVMVSKAEHLRLTKLGYNDTDPELKPSVLALAKLETKTFEVQNKRKSAEKVSDNG